MNSHRRELRNMQSIQHFEAPVEKVFDYFFDPRKTADLQDPFGTQIGEVRLTEEGTGSYYTWRAKMAGIPFEAFELYTDVVPNKHFIDRSSNPMVGTWEYTFEPEGTGTKVVMEHHGRSLWRFPPLSMLMDLAVTRMSQSLMPQLKQRIESAA